MRRLLAVLFSSFLSLSLAKGAEVEIASHVERVTIHLDAAVVERLAEFDIPAGDTTLVVRGIPASLMQQSIHVAGVGDHTLMIGAVAVRPSLLVSPESEPATKLVGLVNEKSALEDRIAAARLKKRAIEGIANTMSSKSQAPPQGDVPAIWAAITTGLDEVDDRIREMRSRLKNIDAQIGIMRRSDSRSDLEAGTLDATIDVTAASAATGQITLSYTVADAKWLPVYDARLEFSGRSPARLAVVRRAEVAQRAGENWNDIKLVLMSSRVTGGSGAPQLPSEAATLIRDDERGEADLPSRKKAADRLVLNSEKLEIPKTPMIEEAARLEATAFNVFFEVPGRVSIPANGATKRYRLDAFDTDASPYVKSVPVRDTKAYLQASFVNVGKAPLLSGLAQLYRNGSFVGHAFLPFTAVGKIADLGFGIDDAVSIRRADINDKSRTPQANRGLASLTREFRTTVSNGHEFTVRIEVEDRKPVSGDASLTIAEMPRSTQPTQRDPDDRRGIVEWSYDYGPGETRVIDFGYRATWPAAKGSISIDTR